ncbi:DUF3888 domain-containing protein [Clostridium botulinum]|uniref:DUF3888 domain-containing protein n=2 Tax=Clostridium TaxID=1485 RepID=UPI00138F1BA6|nr:DUF3888 domain-containing protein [Clostridium botulinum]MBZ1331146.1 DUF3888 domain-containing protein [Clostridium botulinum]MBZ1344947.1 DUF3888 domain-containing protein [Clostridium botulinum]MCW6073649.1 DUF3888 domain-containing protein [Clostridium botulinum]
MTIMFLTITFSTKSYCTVYANNSVMNTSTITENESQKKLENDLILRVFSPYIAKAIENYYGEPRQFDLWDAKIINLKRLEPGSFNFEIKISVTTFKGPHNPPYGLETVTIKVDDSGTHVVNFNHKDK